MAMLQATLKTELVAMELYAVEVDAVSALAAAWSTFFSDAETNGIPILPAALGTAETAMIVALTGMSATGAGAAKIQDGITAWWGVIVAAPASFWPGCILVTPPPTLSGIAAALEAVFVANTSGSLSEEDAYNAIAGVLYPNNLGGIATFPPSLPFPIL